MAKTGFSLEIKGLHVSVESKEILTGLDLSVRQGEAHAIMGPNGSGKSTLANTILGHPKYEVTDGRIIFGGKDVSKLETDERAKAGLFLAMQYPTEIPGVTFSGFLRSAMNSVQGRTEKRGDLLSVVEFRDIVEEKLKVLKMDSGFLERYLNEGFSGGEKKRAEVLQMMLLAPKIAVLDETDSGLDIDSLKIVALAVKRMSGPSFGSLVITHYHRILRYLAPDHVHVMLGGRIVRSGGPALARTLEAKGYGWLRERGGPRRK